MKFRNKILLAIWGVVLGLLVVTYVIINYWMRSQVEARAAEELYRNYSTIRQLDQLRDEEIAKSCQILAETPRLKAVVELGDRNTALQLSQELTQSTLNDIFILTNAQGTPLAQLIEGHVQEFPITKYAPLERAIHNAASTDVWSNGLAVYRCATTPVVVGAELIGTVSIGFQIDSAEMNSIRSMTNSEVDLLVDDAVLATTSGEGWNDELGGWIRANVRRHYDRGAPPEVLRIATAAGLVDALVCRLDAGSAGTHAIAFLFLKPIDREVQAALKPVMESFIILSVAVLAVTAIIGFLISNGITRPIAALVQGTTEVSQGNYDYKIRVGSGEELTFLAQKFEEMSGSLKEKVRQLAEQNTELESALRQLRETQEELVRSERLAATGKLTAQLSHEINNPVHNIQSCLQTILKRMPAASADRELLETAHEEVGRLARLTQQLLQVYRTSMIQEPRTPVSLNDIIREVLAASGQAFRENRLEVVANLEQRLPAIQGSPDKLKQVFLNLFINAKDAMPRGGTLKVETCRANGNVIVRVTDTGVGIPQENVNRIFDAFFTTKSKVSGVGLGLSVTYGIVKQHDGTISVQSRVGAGSTFTLTFPITS